MDERELQEVIERKRAQLGRQTPKQISAALRRCDTVAPPRHDSPIESDFWEAAHPRIADLTPQFSVGPYRVDFAIPPRQLVIELDGHEFHSSVDQRTNDAKRARRLLAMGWRVVRFTGTEIRRGVHRCVDEVLEIMETLGDTNGKS